MANQVVATLAGRFGPALAERAVRRVQPRDPPQVRALQPLGMRAIAEARHLLSAQYFSLQGLLPPPVLEELMVSTETRAMRTDPEHLRLVLSSLSRHCSLNIPYLVQRWEQQKRGPRTAEEMEHLENQLGEIADLVIRTAKDEIRMLEVGDLDSEGEPHCDDDKWSLLLRGFLHGLLKGLTELHGLAVVYWPNVVCDETLEILAEKHTNLKKLAVCSTDPDRDHISGFALSRLATHCAQLKELDLSGAQVMEQGFAALLPRVPNLAILAVTHNSDDLGNAVYKYAMRTPQPPPLKFDTTVMFNGRSCPLEDRSEVIRVFRAIPNVTDVTMRATEEICIGLTATENKFKALGLRTFRPVSVDTQDVLLQKLSPTLTTLGIWGGSDWDLGLIAQHCLGLEHLRVVSNKIPPVRQDFEVTGEQFSKLVVCELAQNGLYPQVLTVPDALLRQVLSAPHLRELTLDSVQVPDHVVAEVCEQASREKRGPLSSLESLTLGRLRGLSDEYVIALMCHSPRLKQLSLTVGEDDFLPGEQPEVVKLFRDKHLPDVKTEIAI